MAIAFRSYSSGTGTSNFVPTKPSGATTGDLLIMHIGFEKGSDVVLDGSGISQWTLIQRENQSANVGSAAFYRIENGDTLLQINVSGGAKQAWSVSRYDGQDSTTPIDPQSGGANGSSGNPNPPSVNPDNDDCMAIITCGNKKAPTGTPPTGYTERVDVANTGDGLGWSYLAEKQLTGSAAEDPGSITASESAEWAAQTFFINPDSATSYELDAATGSHTISGQTSDLDVKRNIDTATGSYSLSGQTADLNVNHPLDVDTGSYSISGVDLILDAAREIAGETGAYTISGLAANIIHANQGPTDVGSYLISGEPANLNKNLKIEIDVGTYTISGVDNAFQRAEIVAVEAGSYSVSGEPAALQMAEILEIDLGTYSISGNSINTIYAKRMPLDAGAYTLSGSDVDLERAEILFAETGSYVIAGLTSDLERAEILEVDSGSYSTTGNPAGFLYAKYLQAEPGSYAISGLTSDLERAEVLVTDVGSFTISGVDVKATAHKIFEIDTGGYIYTGESVNLLTEEAIQVDVGNYSVSELDAALTRAALVNSDVGAYVETGASSIFRRALRLPVESGGYVLSGLSADHDVNEVIKVDSGSYSISGQSVEYEIKKSILSATGSYSITGVEPDLPADIGNYARSNPGLYSISGKSADLGAKFYAPACIGYSFKREAVVYVVYGGNKYKLDLSEINFGQTFQEHSYSIKTLQAKNMFEQSVINKANPANFDITFPAIREDDLRVLFDRALDYDSFDLYIESVRGNFKVENCVISNANFIIERTRPLSMGIQGEAAKVSKISGDVPGTLIPRDANRTYNRISDLSITLGSARSITNALNSVSIELQNEIAWTPYTTVDAALVTSNTSNTMFPSHYTVKKRILAGTFTKYLVETEAVDLFQWFKNASLQVFAGQDSYGFNIDISHCSYTNRIGTGEVFTQSFDWRMTQNPTNLSDVVTYITY